MKFVLVNDRTPNKQSSCVLCREPMRRGYLREVGTDLFYCNHDCYTDHCRSAVHALTNLTGTSLGFLTPRQLKVQSEAER